MSDALLAHYEALYKAAHADVSPLFEQEKDASVLSYLPGSVRKMDDVLGAMNKGTDNLSYFSHLGKDLDPKAVQRANMLADTPVGAAPVAGGARRASPPPPPPPGTGKATTQQAQKAAPQQGAQKAAPQEGAQQSGQQAQKAAPQQAGEAAEEAGEEAAEQGRKGLGLLGGTALAGGAGGGGYLYGQHQAGADANRKRNLAFGAGLATGAVAPQMIRRVGGMLGGGGGQGYPTGGYGGY